MDRPSDFRSDTVTRPTPEMRRAMAEAPVGDDVFGDDPTVRQLEARAAEVLGKPAALFVPSGTMGNQIGLRLHAAAGDEVIVERDSHTFLYEVGGAAALWGIQLHPLAGTHGCLDPGAVAAAVRADDVHLPRTKAVAIENTHTHAGGRVVPLARMRALAEVARTHRLAVHLDGARLWNACTATGEPPAAFAACADTVTCCLSKGLGAPVGSVLAGTVEAIGRARRLRKMLGGGMRQVGILAAAGLLALDRMRARLADDHARARRLADALRGIRPLAIDVAAVETNIVHVGTPLGAADALVTALATRGVLTIAMDPACVRFVTHLDVDDRDVDRAVAAARAACATLPSR